MTNIKTNLIEDLFKVLVENPKGHKTDCAQYRIWRAALIPEIHAQFSGKENNRKPFGPIGSFAFPYFEMGAITSLELFGLDELILFAFYNANRERYRRVVDFGANIGLHTIILARCGFEVRSFEPDPVHIRQLCYNLELNEVKTDLKEMAVSLENGHAEFVRIKGNTTGGHLGGAKTNSYGELDIFEVEITDATPHLAWADLAKIDIEGHEANLVTGLPPEIWLTTDAVMEIGTSKNAEAIYEHLSETNVQMFSQKCGWDRVKQLADMPKSHREGSIFLTGKSYMPWK